MNAIPSQTVRTLAPRENQKILAECRDLVARRLQESFSAILDKVGDVLMDRANRTDIREEQQLFMDARAVMKAQRPLLLAEFEKRLKKRIDDGISGKVALKPDFSSASSSEMSLVETATMDETVITGNIKRVFENVVHDELVTLNRGVGHLMGRPDLETDGNPLAPATIVDAFAEALKEVQTETRIKFQVLKEINQAPLGDLNAIYADLNKHLTTLKVVPGIARVGHAGGGARGGKAEVRKPGEPPPPAAPAEVDVMQMFQRMFASGALRAAPAPMAANAPAFPHAAAPAPAPSGAMPPGMPAAMPAEPGDFPSIGMPAGGPTPEGSRTFAPMPPTPGGYVPGAPIISTVDLHEGLTRLQSGQSDFDVGGAHVAFSGIPTGLHNVLRDLQESPLGQKANQLESMTIEMVAMLFDFIFETRDLPDGIKALLARLQIPVLKAAMLDGAFFAKKTHPARLLVNELAQAGLGWSPVMGNDDPLYKKIEQIVHAVLDKFTDDLALFDELRGELERFLAQEEEAAEANIATNAEEINQRDRREIATAVARSEVERRIEQHAVPSFLAAFLRQQWQPALTTVYMASGDESEAWTSAVTTLEDLVWSVQPKRAPEDRKHLVALLPSLLKRINAGLQPDAWPAKDRERFMSNLVEAHAAAVKPSLANVESPTAVVAEQAKVQADLAKAAGDEAGAVKASELAEAMATAEPVPVEDEREILDDEYLEIARNLERGMWVEFESDDGQLAFAKLAWVSPLRGTYLFTNRQGQKALSITAEELADRFRSDRARLVEAEPLIDRAFSSMMAHMEDKLVEAV